MANLVIVPTDVIPVAGATLSNIFAGVAITAGEMVYPDANGVLKLASAGLTAVEASKVMLALNTAAIGQNVAVVSGGTVKLGAILTARKHYVISATAGKIAPIEDLITGNYVTIIGYALNATDLSIIPQITGGALG